MLETVEIKVPFVVWYERQRRTKTGHGYTPPRYRERKTRLADLLRAMNIPIMTGAVSISVSVTRPPSKTMAKKVKVEDPDLRKPDVDNYVKAVMDAASGILYHDDSQVFHVTGWKVYGETDSMTIRITGER